MLLLLLLLLCLRLLKTLTQAIAAELMCFQEVVIQMTLSSEGLLTVFSGAVVRFFTGMQSEMCLQVALFVESFLAVLKGTHEITRSIVLLQVHLEALLPTVRLIAALDGTDKVFLLLMGFRVVTQVPLGHETL